MKKQRLIIAFCIIPFIGLMSCLFNDDTSGTRGSGGAFVREFDLSKAALPKLARPMVWGGSYAGEDGDWILPGKKDTSKYCLEYRENFEEHKKRRLIGADTSQWETMYFYPSGNEVHYYPIINYTPVYQSAKIYEGMLGSSMDAELLNPGKIYMKGDYKFVGDINRGVHIYDYSDPDRPSPAAFLYLPGNIDVAIKNNTLYANSYSNLVALDISNPSAARLEKVLRKAFPPVYKYGYPLIDSTGGLAVAWKADTVIECGRYYFYDDLSVSGNLENGVDTLSATLSSDTFGKGGSMARFEISSRYLYAVDHGNINIFDISKEGDPEDLRDIGVGWGLETVFKTEKALFIGANTGMYIYDLADPGNPKRASLYRHVTSCDPVVVQEDMAYVTLRSGNFCRRGENTLDIIDVSDIYSPKQIAAHAMINPHGLAVSDTLLFLCEGDSGLKVLSVNDPGKPVTLSHETGFHAFDVIFDNGQLTVIGNNGVYVYDTSNPYKLELLSHTKPKGEGKGFEGNGNRFPVEPWFID